MTERSSLNLGISQRFASWPTALIGIIFIKAVLSLALKPGSFLVSYSGVSYFLLLVLATSFALRNGIQNTLGSRSFWVFLAIGYALWALDEWIYLYYELGRHIEMPNSSIADPILFLHIVPFMAALAAFPHRNFSDHKPYRAILDALLLLFFWSFLYGYAVFPHEFLASPRNYGLRFDILYLSENLALILAAGILALRARTPWRSIYLHLFGACTLYALSSAVANIAIDCGGYVNGKLYGLGLTASVCWFVWIPLRARQLSGTGAGATQSNSKSRASLWAMLTVVVISIPLVWELFHRDETTGVRTFRLLVAIVAVVCLACAAYIREHLVKNELASHLRLTNNQLRLAIKAGRSVGWDWDVKSGRDSWFGDLQTQFGIPSDTYVGRIEDFHRRIHPEDRERVARAIKDAMQSKKSYAAEFRLLWPDGTVRWISAEGEFHYAANGEPKRMLGISVDITDRKRAEERLREYEKAVEGSEEMIAVVDREYRYLIANRKFLDHRGMTKEQVLGHFVPEVLNKGVFETVVKEKLDECFQGKVVRYEMKYTYPELGERDLFISYFPIEGSGGVHRVACILQDITERKLAEEALANMSRAVIAAEECERSRIAKDLHEDIGQRLALLAIEIERLKTEPLNQTVEMLTRIDELWKHTLGILTDVKTSAHELHSPRLEYLSIEAVMRSFCEEFGQRKGVEIDFRSHDLPSLVPPDISLCLFRILQEALYNAVKHSGVRHFEARLWTLSDEIHLTVSDSGTGFDTQAAKEGRGGLGLTSMEQRLKFLKGTFSIESQAQRGTTIHARVPLSSDGEPMSAVG